MTKASITFCGTCVRKVSKNPDCTKPRCPKIRGKFKNKKTKTHSWYNKSIWRGNTNKPLGERGGLREAQLLSHPFCAGCEEKGKSTIATVVDHIQEWKKGLTEQHKWKLFTDPHNLKSLCDSCHNSKTAKTKR